MAPRVLWPHVTLWLAGSGAFLEKTLGLPAVLVFQGCFLSILFSFFSTVLVSSIFYALFFLRAWFSSLVFLQYDSFLFPLNKKLFTFLFNGWSFWNQASFSFYFIFFTLLRVFLGSSGGHWPPIEGFVSRDSNLGLVLANFYPLCINL